MSFVVDTSERLGVPANLIAESAVPPADPTGTEFCDTSRRICRGCGSRFL
jgi:hypothetical protein